jgi:hypothetical protein
MKPELISACRNNEFSIIRKFVPRKVEGLHVVLNSKLGGH